MATKPPLPTPACQSQQYKCTIVYYWQTIASQRPMPNTDNCPLKKPNLSDDPVPENSAIIGKDILPSFASQGGRLMQTLRPTPNLNKTQTLRKHSHRDVITTRRNTLNVDINLSRLTHKNTKYIFQQNHRDLKCSYLLI